MANTKPTSNLGSSAQPINLDGYQPFEGLQKEDSQTAHEQINLDIKPVHITLPKTMNELSLHIDLDLMAENERIRRINEMIERIK